MKIYLFTGPTLLIDDAQDRVKDCVVLPPVTQGDIYCAAREKPWGIGIIDGYFERVPAVWHKEILWALSQGIHVYGCSSMGALRAAELAAFGMKGVGSIFKDYQSGKLEDDDEVTVVHGPGEQGYRLSSDAMVNIRATLNSACDLGIVSQSSRDLLIRIAKRNHYPERYYSGILKKALAEGFPGLEYSALKAWLPDGKIDQKRIDALEMLSLMDRERQDHPQALRVTWQFQHTDAWEQVQCRIDRRPLDRQLGNDTFEPDAALVELKLKGRDFELNQLRATNRAMARELARQGSFSASEASLKDVVESFRLEHQLFDAGSTEAWLNTQGLRVDEFDRLMHEEVGIQRIEAIFQGDINRLMPEYLRLSGTYAALEQRARDKHRLLVHHGVENPGLKSLECTEDELWLWFFGETQDRTVPQNLPEYAESLSFESEHELLRAVIRERWYVTLKDREASD